MHLFGTVLKQLSFAFSAVLFTVNAALAASAVAPAAPVSGTIQLVEFYNAALDHYFMTASAPEIAALDSGATVGWTRTGAEFTVFPPGATTGDPVCRFYGRPEAGLNSHFYSGSVKECTDIAVRFAASWIAESSNVFRVRMPDTTTGNCPSGTTPVYRLFNNRKDANHRYTTDVGVRQTMVLNGYVSEGYGNDGVAFCAQALATGSSPASAVSASIVATPSTLDTYNFSSVATASAGAKVASYAWSFGDGTTGTGATVSHRYTVSGTFPVVLTITDTKGASARGTRTVTATVSGAPSPAGPTPAPPVTPAPPAPPNATPPAGGTAAGDYPMVGPTNKPDIVDLDVTGLPALAAVGLVNGATMAPPFANDPEWLTDPATGMHYLRFSSFDTQRYGANANSRLISWFLKFPGRDVANVRYCLYIEDDVADGMVELGMKLPGIASTSTAETFSWRMEHGPVQPGKRGDYTLLDYQYDAESGSGYGAIHSMGGAVLHAGRWYVIEQHAKLNTPGSPDGEGVVWLNGHEVWRSETKKFRNFAATLLDQVHVNVYHGGTTPPAKPIHYRIARIAVSSSYIGVPKELMGTDATQASPAGPAPSSQTSNPPAYPAGAMPAWRKGMTKGTVYPIANTAKIDGAWALGNGSDMGSNVINAWNGLAAGPTSWWAAANGGHDQGNGNGWENKVYKIDLSANAPQWTLVHPGSPRSAVTVYDHYADGLPTSRHSYYSSQFIVARNRVMQFVVSAPYAIGFPAPAFQGGPMVDGFNVSKGTWDPARTYPDAPFSWTAISVAKDPRTEDVYIAARARFAKWNQAQNTWTTISPVGMNGSYSSYEFHPSLIDGTRNRWVQLSKGPMLNFIDLTSYKYSQVPVTGPLDTVEDYSPLVHDLDNDRYVTIQGTSMYAIDPNTGASSLIATVPKAVNGVQNRLAYFQALGGMAYLPEFASNILFLPTR